MKFKQKLMTLCLTTVMPLLSMTASAEENYYPDLEDNRSVALGSFSARRGGEVFARGNIAHIIPGVGKDGIDHFKLNKPAYLAQGRYQIAFSGPAGTLMDLYQDCNKDGRVNGEQRIIGLSRNTYAYVDLRGDEYVFRILSSTFTPADDYYVRLVHLSSKPGPSGCR
jgi:hypothetical protein